MTNILGVCRRWLVGRSSTSEPQMVMTKLNPGMRRAQIRSGNRLGQSIKAADSGSELFFGIESAILQTRMSHHKDV